METRRKRANITPEGHALIVMRALEPSGLTRTPLAEKLQEEFQSRGYDIPEVETLEKKISWHRKHTKVDPQDKPWSMATLDDYPLPPDTLRTVLWVWEARTNLGRSFTIREAKWVSRLAFALEKNVLPRVAALYARTELMFQIIGQTFDSTSLDRQTLGPKIKITSNMAALLPELAEVYEDEELGTVDGVDQARDLKERRKL